MPLTMPEPRYFSMPSSVVGGAERRKAALNWRPWTRSLTQAPLAWTNSPAVIAAAAPTRVTRSRWPRALTRRTQKAVSGLWKVTRSTRPASASRSGEEGGGVAPRPALPPAWSTAFSSGRAREVRIGMPGRDGHHADAAQRAGGAARPPERRERTRESPPGSRAEIGAGSALASGERILDPGRPLRGCHLVGQVLLGLQRPHHAVEQGLQLARVRQPPLVAGQVETAVDRDPVSPVLDREPADAQAVALVGEGLDGRHVGCSATMRFGRHPFRATPPTGTFRRSRRPAR